MIREITPEDIPTLVAYGSYFWTLTPYVTTGMEYNPETVEDLIVKIATDHYLRVYEVDDKIVGFVGIIIVPFVFNANYTTGQEVFFFVHPEHRGTVGKELIAQAEEDLKDTVDLLAFGELRSSKDMTDYYKNLGYRHSETTFVKVV
jgi:GNAT superfamily N-acetyltransferase